MDEKTPTAITKEFSKKTLERHRLRYPNEYVVRFLSAQSRAWSEREGILEGLDLGFGSGQHLAAMMDFGFRANGIELLEEAVAECGRAFAEEPLLGKLVVGDFSSLDEHFAPQSFLVAWGSLFLRPRSGIVSDLRTLGEAVESGGKLCGNFRSDRNWFAGLGEKLEENHYLLDKRAEEYCNALYTFLNEKEVEDIVEESGWKLESMELYELTKHNREKRHSWYCVTLTKP